MDAKSISLASYRDPRLEKMDAQSIKELKHNKPPKTESEVFFENKAPHVMTESEVFQKTHKVGECCDLADLVPLAATIVLQELLTSARISLLATCPSEQAWR